MNLLLDTHIFIWSQIAVKKLSAQKLQALKDNQNILFLSLASVWEIQIKIQIGKFNFPKPLSDVIKEQQTVNNLQILPITAEHIYHLENLPLHHKDPFDRLLIAQSIVEDYTIVTDDANFSSYSVNLI
ncbi:MAG: PilT protein domain protein [Acidobacteria bacterium]|jgi:PIN domain nuclease of toxin-antitoxin system|nr:PilT protein domain protein [Acidobacteriota bacterium]